MPQQRQRTESAYEELNVSSFVKSCVTFESAVTCFGASDTLADVQQRSIALIGTQEQLQADVVKSLPFFSEFLAADIAEAKSGSVKVSVALASEASAETGPQRRVTVLVGVVPTQASRHNCPTRPDVVSALVQTMLDDHVAPGGCLDVYATSTETLSIVTAVARASNKKFSAKNGLAEKNYVAATAPKVRVVFVNCRLTASARAALDAAATSVQLCQRLVDAPTNLLDTTTFAEIAEAYGDALGFSATILRGEALREAGYGGLYGVGKAAEFPPALVVLSYKPQGSITPEKKIALVGKGVVYDTGGLAIKTPKTNMCGMKHDMGGAGAVFAAFLAAVRMNADCEMACILCLADNAIGPRSQRNDDIVRMRSGLTIEINNTDAEGRLVLGDGVYHASALLPFTPEVIMDMATLTGAQGVATGKYHAAIYSNSGEYETRVVEAGRKCGDLAFPVVYCPEFHNKEFASKVADYKNSVANISNAQVSCAGQFIGNNLAQDYHGAWVHVDLAYPATRGDEGTGFGVALALQTFFGAHFEPSS